MPSRFLMQIVDRETGDVVQWEPGLRVEQDFVDACVQRILSLGVGLGRTAKHVETDVRNGIEQAIFQLKARVKP